MRHSQKFGIYSESAKIILKIVDFFNKVEYNNYRNRNVLLHLDESCDGSDRTVK